MADDESRFPFICSLLCSCRRRWRRYKAQLNLKLARLTCPLTQPNRFCSLFAAQPPQVNRDASGGPPLTFVSTNPSHILASTHRSAPTYLNCDVAVKISPLWRRHLSSGQKFYKDKLDDGSEKPDDEEEDQATEFSPEEVKKMYQLQSQQQHNKSINIERNAKRKTKRGADDDDEEEDELDAPVVSDDIVRRMYQLQSQQRFNKSIKIDEILSNPSKLRNGRRRSKRDAREPLLFEWFRDGEKVISTKSDDKPIINPGGLTLFSNGTLMFLASNSTAGEYRCQAKYLGQKEDFVIGPIVSTATVVEAARKFFCFNLNNFFRLKKVFSA